MAGRRSRDAARPEGARVIREPVSPEDLTGLLPGPSRVLCPIDFSEASRHAAEHAVAIAGWYRAKLTAFHVDTPIFMPVPGLPLPSDRVPEAELARVRNDLTVFFQSLPPAGAVIDVAVDVGQAAPRILQRASTIPVDLIVMATHGSSGFERMVLGSVKLQCEDGISTCRCNRSSTGCHEASRADCSSGASASQVTVTVLSSAAIGSAVCR